MKTDYIRYKGRGEHSVNELEKIIEQREEELHLIKSKPSPEEKLKEYIDEYGKALLSGKHKPLNLYKKNND